MPTRGGGSLDGDFLRTFLSGPFLPTLRMERVLLLSEQ